MRGKIQAFMYNGIKKKTVVELQLDGNQCERLEKLQDKDITAKFAIFREKRSLSANAYAWVLINKLADAMGLADIDVYRSHIKEMGVYRDVEINADAENTLIHIWLEKGIGWFAERVDYGKTEDTVILRLYYGSSVYNTKQMTRLINSIVQDCTALGIETMTDSEIAHLIRMSEEMKV